MSLRAGAMSLRAQRGNLLTNYTIVQVSYKTERDCHVVPPRNDRFLEYNPACFNITLSTFTLHIN
ncbi:MAG: hypothetical protein ACI9N9_002783 [Enterobacterales bacterium]|jgi:hypothetical protein